MDSSDIQADASNNSVVNTEDIRRYLNKSYRQLEKRLDDDSNQGDDDGLTPPKSGDANSKYVSHSRSQVALGNACVTESLAL